MSKLKKIFSNNDYKSLLENFLSLGVLQVANLLLPMLVLPYMIKVVGLDKYGVIVVAASLVNYFQAIVDYSFSITGTRDIAVFRNNRNKINFIFSRVMSVKTIFLFLSLFIITTITLLFPKFSEYSTIIYLSMLMLVGKVLFPDWYFQGIEKMKYISFINVTVKVILTFSVFFLIKEEKDYWIYPLTQSLGFIIAGIAALYVVFVKHKVQLVKVKNRQIKNSIVSNFPIFINQFMPTLYNNTSSFLLGLLVSNTSAGLFDAVKKIVDLVVVFINVVSRVVFPFLNRKKKFFHVYRKLLLGFVVLITILMILLSDYIFSYFNIENNNAFKILFILSIGIIGYAMYNVFATNYLIIRRLDKLVMKNTLLVSLVGFLVSFPLIYYFSIIGACVNVTLSRMMIGIGAFYLYLKNKEV